VTLALAGTILVFKLKYKWRAPRKANPGFRYRPA